MSTEVSNSNDVIDSRDVIARIEELEGELEAARDNEAEEKREENPDFEDPAFDNWLEAVLADPKHLMYEEAVELKALRDLAEEAEGYAEDWRHGATLIRESYFEDYCRELVSDIGDMPKEIPSYIEIDWAKTADNIRADYTEVDFDGVAYLVR